jgi:hypothetical protein
VTVSCFIGGGNLGTQRKPPTCYGQVHVPRKERKKEEEEENNNKKKRSKNNKSPNVVWET